MSCADLEGAFAKYDSDSDQLLTKADLYRIPITDQAHEYLPSIAVLMNELDVDGEEGVSKKELLALCKQAEQEPKQEQKPEQQPEQEEGSEGLSCGAQREMFARFDVNRDGLLSVADADAELAKLYMDIARVY